MNYESIIRVKNQRNHILFFGVGKLFINSGNEIMKYISERQFMPVTAGYNVTVKEPLNQMDMENMIVDIYVGVCDNIL